MNKRGFTIVELLIVIVIIGILAVALLPIILEAPAKSRDAARESGLNSIVTAIETYVSEEDKPYPDTACLSVIGADLTSYFQGGVYPEDPSGVEIAPDCFSYYYVKLLDGDPANYALVIQMEKPERNNASADILTAITNEDAEVALGCEGDACVYYAKLF